MSSCHVSERSQIKSYNEEDDEEEIDEFLSEEDF